MRFTMCFKNDLMNLVAEDRQASLIMLEKDLGDSYRLLHRMSPAPSILTVVEADNERASST